MVRSTVHESSSMSSLHSSSPAMKPRHVGQCVIVRHLWGFSAEAATTEHGVHARQHDGVSHSLQADCAKSRLFKHVDAQLLRAGQSSAA
eukprot:2514592-Prymnesium_polylepis.1